MKRKSLLLLLLLALVAPCAVKGQTRATLTVHDGTTTNSYVPVYGYYADAYLKCEMVYPASELTAMSGGQITALKFYASQSSVSWDNANFQVFVAEVSSASINSFNGPGTVVYNNSLNISNGEMTVTFTTPYTYNGGNLLVGVYNTTTGSYVTSSWYGQDVNNSSYQGYSYSSLDAVSGTQRNFLPKTTFTYTPGSTPYISVSPTSATLVTGATQTLTATYGNVTNPNISWASSNTNVATVNGNGTTATVTGVANGTATITATMTYNGTNYTATSTITVDNSVVIGTGTSTGNYTPLVGNYKSSYDQMIYTASQLQDVGIITAGSITKIGFNSSVENSQARNVKIYMGHTSKTSFTSGTDFIAFNDLTLVYDYSASGNGQWNITAGWNEFELDTPFDYDGASNLVIAVHCGLVSDYSSTSFYYTTTSSAQAVYAYNDSTDPIPATYDGNWSDYPTTGSGATSYKSTTTSLPNLKVFFEVAPQGDYITQITSNDDWEAFCAAVNGGHDYSGETVHLRANISITSQDNQAGMDGKFFKGTFEGHGNTITVNMTATGKYCAPFYGIQDAAIKDLVVTGSITSAHEAVGGICGILRGTSTFTNCVSNVAITSTCTSSADDNNGRSTCGGFVGVAGGNDNPTFVGCAFTGSLTASRNGCGGFVGFHASHSSWSSTTYGGRSTYTDCLFVPSSINISASETADFSCGYNSGQYVRITITNSYYNEEGAEMNIKKGTRAYTITGGEDVTVAMNGTANPTYNVSVISVYSPGITLTQGDNTTIYAKSNDQVSLNLSTTASVHTGYTASAGSLSGSANPYTLTMPASNVVINNEGCEAISTLPYSENFDSYTSGLPSCWEHIGNGTGAVYNGTAHSTSYSLRFSGATSDNIVVLPEFEQELSALQINFWTRPEGTSSSPGSFDIGYITDVSNVSTFAAVATYSYSDFSGAYLEKTVYFGSAPNGSRLAMRHRSSSTIYYWFVDDINVNYAPACLPVTNLTVSDITAHTVTVNWTGGSDNHQSYDLYYSTDEVMPQTPIQSQFIGGITAESYELTGLDPETTYYVWVRNSCGTDGYSDWVSTQFTTDIACPAPTNLTISNITGHTANITWNGTSESYVVSYRTAAYMNGIDEQFTTASLPTNWETKSGSLAEVMAGTTELSSGGYWGFEARSNVFGEGNIHAYNNIYGSSRKDWLISPRFTVGTSNNTLSFDLALTDYYNADPIEDNTAQADDRFVVLITTDNETTWINLREWNNSGSSYVYNNIATAGQTVTINLSSYAGQNVRIAFYGESTVSGGDNDLHLDNVHIGTPVAAGDWQTVTVEEATATLTGLAPETIYEVKVQGDCGDDGMSQEVVTTFTTDVACIAPTNLRASNVLATTANLSWTDNSGASEWQICLNGNESQLIDVTETSYTLENLTPETVYTVKVRANCGGEDGMSLWSNEISFTTLEACPVPYNLTIPTSEITANSAFLTWVGESDSYNVSWGVDGEVTTLVDENFSSSIPAGWTNDATYPWTIVNGHIQSGNAGVGSSTSAISIVKTFGIDGYVEFDAQCMGEGSSYDVCEFKIDNDVKFTKGANGDRWDHYNYVVTAGQHTFTWSYSKDGSVNPDGDYFAVDNVKMYCQGIDWSDPVSVATTEYNITGLAPSTKYYVKVQGVCSDESTAWSDIKSFTTTSGYQVSVSVNNSTMGSASIIYNGETVDSPASIAPDTEVTVNAVPGDGFVFVNWTEPNSETGAYDVMVSDEVEYSFTPVGNRDLRANFAVAHHTLTIIAAYGTVEVDGTPYIEPIEIVEGGEVYVKLSDWGDYQFSGWTVDGTGSEVEESALSGTTFTMGTTNTVLTANFDFEEICFEAGEGTSYETSDHWFLFTSPLNVSVTPGDVYGLFYEEDPTSEFYDLYCFDQTEELEWLNWKESEENGGHFDLVAGKGYLYANGYADVELCFTGEPYNGNGNITITNIPDNNWAGWNLVGNPYNCEMYSSMSYFAMNNDGDNGPELVSRTTDISLQPMEGFFVYCESGTGTVSLSTTAPNAKHTSLSLNISRGRGLVDRAIVSFSNGNTLPKFQLNPNHTKVYIPKDEKDYAVVDAESEMGEMPVNFKAERNGSYTISVTSEGVRFGYLHLIDNMTGNDIDLLATPSYTFDAMDTDYASRFKLVFATGSSTGSDAFAFYSNGNWIINNEGGATLQVVDVTGRIIKSETINGCANVNFNAAPGVYMLRLVNGDNVKVQKVVVR